MSERIFRSNVLTACGLALLLAAGSAGAAQITVSPNTAPPASEAPPLTVKDNAVLLTVDEAVDIALRQNLDIVLQSALRNESRLGIEQNLGIYDLLLTGSASAASTKSAPTSAIVASQEDRQSINVGLSQLVPTGGVFTFGFDNSRRKSNLSFSSFNPLYTSGLTFAYNQPLLQNFGRLSTERNLLIARSRSLQSRQDFVNLVQNVVQQVVNAYWNLVGAREQLVVAQDSLNLAKELHQRNKIQVDVGTMAPLELIQSEAAIASREGDIISAQSAVGDAEDTLRRILGLQQGPLWNAEIRPATDPLTDRITINVDDAIRSALDRRTELRNQEQQLEQARINAQYFKNQLRPRLDLDVQYTPSGAGGTLVERDPVTGEIVGVTPGNYNDAFSQLTGFRFYGWQASLTFSYPLQNRAARAQSAIANIEVDRNQTLLEQTRQNIITEVRQAARRVDTAAKQIDAAKASRQFQEKNLESEKKRYENGMSNSFQITRIQLDVTTARSAEVNAVIGYRTALAAYYRAVGQLLDTQNIQVEDPEDAIHGRFSLFGRH